MLWQRTLVVVVLSCGRRARRSCKVGPKKTVQICVLTELFLFVQYLRVKKVLLRVVEWIIVMDVVEGVRSNEG
jgi:hypothetical protein